MTIIIAIIAAMCVLGAPVRAEGPIRAPLNPRTDFAMSVSLDRADGRYVLGEEITLVLSAERECYATLFAIGASGRMTALAPDGLPACNPLRANAATRIAGVGNLFAYCSDAGAGRKRIIIVATARPMVLVPDALAARRDGPFTLIAPENAPALMAHIQESLSRLRDCPWAAAEVAFEVGQQRDSRNIRGVAVGISDYAGAGENTQFAARDAEAFAEALQDALGLSEGHIVVLRDLQATPRAILDALRHACAEARGGRVYFFFSGNGGRTPDDNGDEADGKDEYLCASGGIVLDDDLARAVNMPHGPALVLFLDVSFDCAKTLRHDAIASARIKALPREEPGGISLREGWGEARLESAFSACGPAQSAQESERLQHGVFTYFLIKGLRGRFDELAGYVSRSVSAFTNGEQTPCFVGRRGP